jgi:hypothetical protein
VKTKTQALSEREQAETAFWASPGGIALRKEQNAARAIQRRVEAEERVKEYRARLAFAEVDGRFLDERRGELARAEQHLKDVMDPSYGQFRYGG